MLAYGIHRRDPVIILGQTLSFFIYFRNLALIAKERRQRGKVSIEGGNDRPGAAALLVRMISMARSPPAGTCFRAAWPTVAPGSTIP